MHLEGSRDGGCEGRGFELVSDPSRPSKVYREGKQTIVLLPLGRKC